MELIKPKHLNQGDSIATISPCNGWAGDSDCLWRYRIGVQRLKNIFGLNVVAAPNSLKGSDYLEKNPQARAEDIMWAFENSNVKAIIANVGGNDSIKVVPYIDANCIKNNPKIFIGYSDVQNIHFLCRKAGLSTFYGANLLSPLAEPQELHPYCEKWFRKVLFDPSPIGTIEPSESWTYEPVDYFCPATVRRFYPNPGYSLIHGKGRVQGRLMGGHTGIMELANTRIEMTGSDFENTILFFENIPECFTPEHLAAFVSWLGRIGALQKLKGIIIGKLDEARSFDTHRKKLLQVIDEQYGLTNLPILYGLNFGHSSPVFALPYGAMAEINCNDISFSILESGVI